MCTPVENNLYPIKIICTQVENNLNLGKKNQTTIKIIHSKLYGQLFLTEVYYFNLGKTIQL